jgi:glycosyltransferase involved in cell wall biosynthesis
MKTLCVLESVSRNDGGIFEAECALQKHLSQDEGVEVKVVGLEDKFIREDSPRWMPLIPKALSVVGPSALGYSPEFSGALDREADLLYAASLWRYPSWAALRWKEMTGKPMIVAPHGSLDGWALQHSYFRKRIAGLLFKDRQLSAASCLRALSGAELNSFRAYGLKNPICVIPNGVELPEPASRSPRVGKRTLLFLGRIHPKKGLMNCLRAFAQKQKYHGWNFLIAGWDQGGHEAELKQLCVELGLRVERGGSKVEGQESAAEVVFWGPAFGAEKTQLLRSVDAFILPSLSEGLPMAVLEAWSHGLPVVMTPECNLPEGFMDEAAIRIHPDVQSISVGLEELFSMPDSALQAMGTRGRQLVEQRFSWTIVARQMKQVYGWLIGGGVEPECVIK